MPRWPGFIGGYGVSQSLIGDAEDTVNLYVERLPSQGLSAVAASQSAPASALLGTPGYRPWSVVGDANTRALIFAAGRFFGLVGQGFYEWDINAVATKRGTVAIDANPGQFAYNGQVGGQIGVCSGGNIYSYDLATNVLTATDRVGGYTHLSYAAGYGLAFNHGSGRTYLSALEDFTTWDNGTFYTRSLFADPQRAQFVDENNLVWIIGSDTFEVRYNSGSGTQPFIPLSGLVGLIGIAAPFAYALSAVGNAWIANNPQGTGQLVMTSGSAPSSVSSFAVSTATAAYLRGAGIADAELLMYEQEKHTFACIAYPAAVKSWAYDIEGQSWARRGRWNPQRADYDLWSPRCHCMAFGKHMVGDRQTGIIAEMDTTIATELDGTGIRRLRVATGLRDELKRLTVDRFMLLMDVGLGAQAGQGAAPTVMLQCSDDGGRTFGNEMQCGSGAVGAWQTLVYWDRLGLTTQFVPKITFSDPVPFRIVDAYINNLETGGR